MEIGSVGASPNLSAMTQARAPERAERGPDHDNDGDEGGAAAVKALPVPPPGRGGKVDIVA
ncbi:MAG: hypothetical protein ACM33T_16685 [Solirubrobacterales bacterium]